MTPTFERVQKLLKQLPGLGFRSAERLALSLLVEKPEQIRPLLEALEEATQKISRCTSCGNLCEEEKLCSICKNHSRRQDLLCIVESIPDLYSIERSGSYEGRYHVLHGKLSPIKGIGPEQLNLAKLKHRLLEGDFSEIVLALDNDVEAEATCHFIQQQIIPDNLDIKITRIGFGLPSGGGVVFADSATLKSAFEGRKNF